MARASKYLIWNVFSKFYTIPPCASMYDNAIGNEWFVLTPVFITADMVSRYSETATVQVDCCPRLTSRHLLTLVRVTSEKKLILFQLLQLPLATVLTVLYFIPSLCLLNKLFHYHLIYI